MQGQDLNINYIVVWVVVLTQLLNFGLMVWNLMSSGSRANTKRLDEHAVQIDGHNLRIGSVEQTLRNGPTSADMHELELTLERALGKMETLSAVLEGHVAIMERLETVVARHENYLLDGSKR
jgi:hypothetical protein